MRRLAWMLAAVVLWGAAASGATRYDPRLRFRTLSTERFDIHFHQGEEALAERLARIAEQTAADLDATLGPPGGRVQVILVDQSDLSNGWATPLPYNTIEITAAAPLGGSVLGNTDDWLRLVFTHEYTHIVHLGRGAGWIGGLRRVFGRLPVLYPNLFQPAWQIEGIATWQESSVTGAGRLPAGDFRQLLERGAASGRFEPLDRASSALVDWPAGHTAYLYGGYFHRFLATRYGEEKVRDLVRETARRPPYFGARAFRKVFDRPLGELWAEYEKDVATGGAAAPVEARRLTAHGFVVSGPRYRADGRLFYSVSTPHAFPALMELGPGTAAPRRVADRFLGNRIGIAGPRLVVDQVDFVNSVGLQSDLYEVEPDSGAVRRLTREARAADPDVSPDGRSIACTVQRADRRELAIAPLDAALGGYTTPVPLASEAGVHFGGPRWSPDGRTIAAERRRTGGASEIVLVDAASGTTRTLAGGPSARSVSPAWSADGARVLFASAVSGRPFQVFAIDVESGRVTRLEGTGSSAESPEISPDGRTLVFVGYTPDGYDLFSLPLDAARWSPVDWPASGSREGPADAAPGSREEGRIGRASAARPYRARRTLAPQFWTPTIESDADELVIGAATASLDALGRHAYGVEAGWSSRARPDWQAFYAYDRWRPTLFVSASDDTDPFRAGEARSREVEAGLVLPFRRVRRSNALLLAGHASQDSVDCSACDPAIGAGASRRSIRAGWNFASARSFGYSISAEEGSVLRATAEWTREALGADGDGGAWTAEARHYLRAWPRHAVIAARAAAARAWGDDAVRREFSAAGSDPKLTGFDFDSDAVGLLRGFDEADVRGTRAAVVNVDYRVPLGRIDRGVGTLPVFVRVVHAAAFVDAGHAWSASFRRRDLRVSIGAELSIDTVLGYVLPVTFSGGAAWRRSPNGIDRGAVAFARIGRAF